MIKTCYFRLISFLIVSTLLIACSDENNTPQADDDDATNYPNILLIIADDMGLDATPGYSEGVQKPNMPNLDRLISSGITFDNAWAYPLCSPTRASILTGKYGSQTGVLSVETQLYQATKPTYKPTSMRTQAPTIHMLTLANGIYQNLIKQVLPMTLVLAILQAKCRVAC